MIKFLAIKAFAVLMMAAMFSETSFSQTRIRFARGASSATVSGSLSAGGSRSYILGARAGQTMTVSVSSRNGAVSVDVGGNNVGTGDSFQLRSTDDYIITVENDGGATSYSLYVAIR